MNYTGKVIELGLKITHSDGKSYIVFPRYFGGTVTSAETITNGAIRGKDLPLLKVHPDGEGVNRLGDTVLVNALRINSAEEIVLNVPASITDLYKAPSDETEEDKETRLLEIKRYFETK